MKKFWCIIFLNISCILIYAGYNQQAVEAKSWTSENHAALLVQPILPKDNVGGQSRGYFDLPASAQSRLLKVHVFNTTATPLTVRTKIVEAGTLDNGVIDYSGQQPLNHDLLPHPGIQYMTVAKQTVIPAQTGVDLTIKVAPFNFTGVKASALKLAVITNQENSSIQNQYVYGIAIILNGKKVVKKQSPKVQALKVNPRMNRQEKPVLSVNLANQQAAFIHQSQMQVQLQNQRWGLVTYSKNRSQVSVAPKTAFNYDLPLAGKRLVPGMYQMTIQINGQLQKEQTVKITKNAAQLINQQNVAYLKRRNLIWLGSGVIVLIIIGFAVSKRRHNRNRQDESVE